MAPARRHECGVCARSFIKDFMLMEDEVYTQCLFCEIRKCVSAELTERENEVGDLAKRVQSLEETLGGLAAKDVRNNRDREEEVDEVGLRTIVATEESNSNVELEPFRQVRRGPPTRRLEDPSEGIETANRFHILQDQVEEEPSLFLVGDSIVRHQEEEFCRRKGRRKNYCFPGVKIEGVKEKVADLVSNAPQESVFVVHVGTNDLAKGRSEEVFRRYTSLIKEFRDRRTKVVISGILPRFDLSHTALSRLIGINRRLRTLCDQESDGVGFVDMWDHFSSDRTLFGRDGLHLNAIGKARFGRVLEEELTPVLTRLCNSQLQATCEELVLDESERITNNT